MAVIVQSAALGLGAAALLLISYAIGSAIYNIYFHPLHNFPGPKLAAASKIPYALNRCRGLQSKWTKAMHDKYGEVVRLAPDQLSFTSVEAWRDIYGHKVAGKGGMPKGKHYATNDEDHARHRRLLAHAFSDKALREQEPLINKYVSLLVAKLSDATQSALAVDMVRMYNYCTFDIMGDLAFGEPLGLLEQSDYTPWVAAIFGTIKTGVLIATITNNFPTLGAAIRRFCIPAALVEKRATHRRFAEARVDARLANAAHNERPDIWTFVLRHAASEKDDAGKGLRLEEMHADGSTLMVAGTETTATLLSGLTYHLLQNPPKLHALATEIRAAFARPEDMDMASLARLPYLHACLEEGLRILAYHEMRLILANVLWHFDLDLCAESKDWMDQEVYTIWEKGPLMCKLKPVVRG
ncbi:putative cytochrome p450 [Diplodia seriata]|uniref:Putative cytochrome p450 n=1 Tax=Diplodia seriata TaxID=420778 RepID=A0A0G2GP26_9PEZI|nr:putative cytochrome p450 [Diplodia seriata]